MSPSRRLWVIGLAFVAGCAREEPQPAPEVIRQVDAPPAAPNVRPVASPSEPTVPPSVLPVAGAPPQGFAAQMPDPPSEPPAAVAGPADDPPDDGGMRMVMPVRRFVSHTHDVSSMAVTPDGTVLVTHGADRDGRQTDRFLDAATGKVLHEVEHEVSGTIPIVSSPDGTWVAIANDGRGIRLHDPQTGRQLRQFDSLDTKEGLTKDAFWGVKVMAVSPRGDLLVAADRAKLIGLDPQTGRQKFEWSAGEQDITGMAFCPDGRHLATGSRDGRLRLWSVPDGTFEELTGHPRGEQVLAVAVSSDGRRLAAAIHDREVTVYDLPARQPRLAFPYGGWRIDAMQFLPGTPLIVRPGSWEQTITRAMPVYVQNAATGETRAALDGYRDTLYTLALTGDGRTLFAGGAGGEVCVWDLRPFAASAVGLPTKAPDSTPPTGGGPDDGGTPVADVLEARKAPTGLRPTAVPFTGPPGNGRRGANGFLLPAADESWKGGSLWRFAWEWDNTARGVHVVHPWRDGHALILIYRDYAALFPGGAWPHREYLGKSPFPVQTTAASDRTFPLPSETPHEIVSRLDADGRYSLSIGGQTVLTATLDAVEPLRLPDTFQGRDLPPVWPAGAAGLIIGPRDGGINRATHIEYLTPAGADAKP